MNYLTERNIISESPALAGPIRFLAGLIVMMLGLYLGFFHNGAGNGVGFLLMFASPFIILTDKREED